MSAPECTCVAVYEPVQGGVQMNAPFVKHCPLHAAAAQMYEALEDWLRTDNRPETINPAVAKTERATAAARGETERVR